MRTPTLLIHHGAFQTLWQQPGLIQIGPHIPWIRKPTARDLSIAGLRNALRRRGWAERGTDSVHGSVLLRTAPIRASANGQDRGSSHAEISITVQILSGTAGVLLRRALCSTADLQSGTTA